MIFNKKLQKKESVIFAGLLILLFAIFGWRQFYGFNKNDEIFYISTVYRFFQGDAMLIDEWNNVQLFAFVTYPLYLLIRLFHHSNEGMVLIFRICYLIFQMMVAIYCYVRMKRFGGFRIVPALFYVVTTPYNINGLSYNTLAFGFVLLVLVTLASEEHWNIRDGILCGFFTAGAVLANPYVVLLFVVYGLISLVYTLLSRKKGKEIVPGLSFRTYLWMVFGAFLIFLLFVAFVFSRGTLEEILEGMPYIVMDTERQKSFWEKFSKYFIRIHRYYGLQVYVTAALIVLWLADHGKKIPSYIYIAVSLLSSVPFLLRYGFFWEMVGINYVLVPLAFPGLIAYIVTKQKDRKLFWGWYVPGLFYTLLAHFATNTGILTVSASYMIPSAASMLLIWQALKESPKKEKIQFLFYAVLFFQFAAGIYLRITYVWGDEHLPLLTEELEQGPLKGIHTSAENKQIYLDVMQDMEDLSLTKEDRLFVIGIAPWMYLNTEAECAAYSTWETLETDPLIPVYYEIHPEKLPTVIYCYEYDESILDTDFACSFISQGYDYETVRHGIVLTHR